MRETSLQLIVDRKEINIVTAELWDDVAPIPLLVGSDPMLASTSGTGLGDGSLSVPTS